MFRKSILLRNIYLEHRWPLAGVYSLNIVQELAYLSIPAAAGMLIDTFISGKGYGFWAFVAAYLCWQGSAMFRKIVDTVVFSKVYNAIVLRTLQHHRKENIDTGTTNARIELLKQVVNFFEQDLPFLVNSLVAMFGAATLLFFYNKLLMVVCVVIIIPSLIFNYFFGKKMILVTGEVNNAYEKQVEVIENEDIGSVKEYFAGVRKLNIRKSSLEAFNFGTIEIFVFLMIFISLYIICQTPGIDYGKIVAMYGYILRFAYSFDFIPHLTERFATIRDIQKRLEDVYHV